MCVIHISLCLSVFPHATSPLSSFLAPPGFSVGTLNTLDLLLMLWPIFFVYAVPREAQYKARNFRKSAKRASGLARTLKTSVSFKPKEQRLPIRPSRAPQSCCEEIVSPCVSLQSLGSVTPDQVRWYSLSNEIPCIYSRNVTQDQIFQAFQTTINRFIEGGIKHARSVYKVKVHLDQNGFVQQWGKSI